MAIAYTALVLNILAWGMLTLSAGSPARRRTDPITFWITYFLTAMSVAGLYSLS